MTSIRHKLTRVMLAVALALPLSVRADEDLQQLKRELELLKQKVERLEQEQARTPAGGISREEATELKQQVRKASKDAAEWKRADSVVHLAGYAAVGYTNQDGDVGTFNQANFNPIFHYQYKDLLLLESELETEIGEDGDTEVALEYATLDLFLHDYLALVGGKFLSPLGNFVQNVHPAWINKLPSRPAGFGHDQAAPTSDVGLQVRGGFPVGNAIKTTYGAYVGNGPRLELNDAGDEIEMIEAEGATSDEDSDKVIGGRISVLPIPKLEIGVSGAIGDVALEDEADRDYDVLGADGAFQWRNLDLRGEYIQQHVDALSGSVAPGSGKWKAWYVQAAYKLAPAKLEGVVRYGDFNSPQADQEQEQFAIGLNYLFGPNVIAKVAYEFNDGENGEPTDEDRFLIQLAYGF